MNPRSKGSRQFVVSSPRRRGSSHALVSVIIPTYNRAHMLDEAIRSVLEQDYPEIELIVVDDGSTDGTQDLLKKYAGRMETARTENCGVSHARNVGIKMAKGAYYAFLDSDDIWMKGKISAQIDFFAKNPDIFICQTEELWFRNRKRVNPRNVHKKHSGWIFKECIPLCIISPSAVMIKKELFDDIGLFDEAMPACEDYDLWLRASLKYQMVTLDEPLIMKRGGHDDQLSNMRGQDIWRIYALEKLLKNGLQDPELVALVKADIKRRAEIVANGAEKRGNLKLAEEFRIKTVVDGVSFPRKRESHDAS